MRIAIVGDTHGNTRSFVHTLNQIGKRKITHVFVVGDFGLWTHFADGHEFLDDVNATAEANKLTVFAVGGNHENWDHWEWFVDNMPKHKGMAMVRRRVLLAPKIHHFKLAGKQFVVAGGAVSVDKDMRLMEEYGTLEAIQMGKPERWARGARTLYWPNETLTDYQVELIEKVYPKADILLTHDCSNYTHFHGRLKPDPDSEQHRKKIDRVIAAVQPEVHFHGHMHDKYEWENVLAHGYKPFDDDEWTGPVTTTYGLECDGRQNNWGVLETDTMEFAFLGEGMHFRSLEGKKEKSAVVKAAESFPV